MISAGLLKVRTTLSDGCLGAIDVDLQRPAVTQLFHGRSPDVVVKLVPSLYTICTQAQAATARAALAVAAEVELPTVDDAALWVETLHEHLWRLLLDWPSALGLPPAKAEFIAWRAGRSGGRCAEETHKLMEGTLYELAEKSLEKLVDRNNEASAAGLTTALETDEWLGIWRDSGELPTAQLAPPSLAAAYRTRINEVERAAAALKSGACFPLASAGGDGWGVAQTLTARGVLTHAVHLDAGKIAKYRVLAPTDAFFANAGALAGLLESRRFDSTDDARRMLDRAVLALDPCVPYVLELNDA